MKELRGTASATVPVPIETALALLEAVDDYPSWYPEVVRNVEVLERRADGPPELVRTTLHVAQGPIARDFELAMDVTVQRPSTVKLSRVPNEANDGERFDVIWHLSQETATRIELELLASLDIPRFLPIGGIGNSVAQGFVTAAVERLSGSAG
jgi:ribosome-associated toxin RatA of RatAB toxin-antitoxin module